MASSDKETQGPVQLLLNKGYVKITTVIAVFAAMVGWLITEIQYRTDIETRLKMVEKQLTISRREQWNKQQMQIFILEMQTMNKDVDLKFPSPYGDEFMPPETAN
jgi:hypothetical protein